MLTPRRSGVTTRAGARSRAFASIALAVALIAGCGAPAVTPRPSPSYPVDDGVVATLAASGIAVVPSFTDDQPLMPVVEPRAPLTFTAWQASHLDGQGAVFGFQLDELGVIAGIPADSLPFSYVVAAWASTFETPGAIHARQLLGERDWLHPQDIVFPQLVLALFVADMTRDAAAPGVPTTAAVSMATADPLTGLTAAAGPADGADLHGAAELDCGVVSGFVDAQLAAVLDKLTGGSDSALATAATIALEAAKTVIGGLLSVVLAPILVPIKTAVTIVGLLATITSLLTDWDVVMTHTSDPDHFAHPDEPDHEGTFTATVKPGLGGWPDEIAGCAATLTGAPLPDLAPAGKSIEWITISDAPTAVSVATVVSAETDDVIGSDNTATLAFEAGREGMLMTGSEFVGRFEVIARIRRFTGNELDQLIDKALSGPAGSVIKDLLSGPIAGAKAKLADLMLQEGKDATEIGYHNPHCLVGTWQLDPASYLAALKPVVSALSGSSSVPSGAMVFTFTDDGTLTVQANAFTALVTYPTVRGDGVTITVELRSVISGAMAGTFALEDTDSGETIVDGASGKLVVVATKDTIKVSATATVDGHAAALPMTWPSVLGTGSADYLCDPELLVVAPKDAKRSFTYLRVESDPATP